MHDRDIQSLRAQAQAAIRSGSPVAAMHALQRVHDALPERWPTAATGPHTAGSQALATSLRPGYYETQPIPDRFLVLPTRPEVAPGATSQRITLEFKGSPGHIIAIFGRALTYDVGGFSADDLIQASTFVKIELNGGQTTLTTNGQSAAFVSFASLFPTDTHRAPFDRVVQASDRLEVTFYNDQPAVGGVSIVPEFGVWMRK